MSVASGMSGGTQAEAVLRLIRHAQARFASIVFASRLHSLHSANAQLYTQFNLTIPRVRLKELDAQAVSVYSPIHILVAQGSGDELMLLEDWEIQFEPALYKGQQGVDVAVLSKKLVALSRALHAFLRLLPAHSRYQAHRAQYLRSGEDLFNVTLVLSPSSAATFGAVGTRAQSLGSISTEEGTLRVAVTYAPTPAPTKLPLPLSSTEILPPPQALQDEYAQMIRHHRRHTTASSPGMNVPKSAGAAMPVPSPKATPVVPSNFGPRSLPMHIPNATPPYNVNESQYTSHLEQVMRARRQSVSITPSPLSSTPYLNSPPSRSFANAVHPPSPDVDEFVMETPPKSSLAISPVIGMSPFRDVPLHHRTGSFPSPRNNPPEPRYSPASALPAKVDDDAPFAPRGRADSGADLQALFSSPVPPTLSTLPATPLQSYVDAYNRILHSQ